MALIDSDALDEQEMALKVKREILIMSFMAQVGHVPSALSMSDYLCVAFNSFVDPHRDRLLLGKPYGAQAYYAVFANKGWIDSDWEKYGSDSLEWTYTMSREHHLVDFIDDTLGNALGVACGVAISHPGLVFVNIGDAYLQAGSATEAIMYAGAKRLSNLLLVIDNNHMQVLGTTNEILDVEPLEERFDAYGWKVIRANGHNFKEIKSAFNETLIKDFRPTVIVFDTVKGQGVSFLERNPEWHYRLLDEQSFHLAMEELQ